MTDHEKLYKKLQIVCKRRYKENHDDLVQHAMLIWLRNGQRPLSKVNFYGLLTDAWRELTNYGRDDVPVEDTFAVEGVK
jgi:hypothetical protein